MLVLRLNMNAFETFNLGESFTNTNPKTTFNIMVVGLISIVILIITSIILAVHIGTLKKTKTGKKKFSSELIPEPWLAGPQSAGNLKLTPRQTDAIKTALTSTPMGSTPGVIAGVPLQSQ